MYDFSEYLDKDEKILIKGKSYPEKNAAKLAPIIIILILFIISLIYIIKEDPYNIDLIFTIGFFIAIIFIGAIYEIFVAPKNIKDNYFCVTNERILIYDKKSDYFAYGYLENYDVVEAIENSPGYGDISLYNSPEIKKNIIDNAVVQAKHLQDLAEPNSENMPHIFLASIKNPKKVEKIILKAQKELMK